MDEVVSYGEAAKREESDRLARSLSHHGCVCGNQPANLSFNFLNSRCIKEYLHEMKHVGGMARVALDETRER